MALGAFVVGDYSSLGATILLVLGTVVFVFGILELIYSIGFLEGKGWSWAMGMVVAAVSLFLSIGLISFVVLSIELAGPIGTSGPPVASSPSDFIAWFILFTIAGIAVIPPIPSSVTIILLTRPHVKAFFGKARIPQA